MKNHFALSLTLPFIACILIGDRVTESKKYDLERVDAVVDYGNINPPPPNDDWEYLTYQNKRWIFLSANESIWDLHYDGCRKLCTKLRDAKADGFKEYVVAAGIDDLNMIERRDLLELLAKLKVKSFWGRKDELPVITMDSNFLTEEFCYLQKLDDEGEKYQVGKVDCTEKHTALCLFNERKEDVLGGGILQIEKEGPSPDNCNLK